jgi:hypothetical protein
MTIRKGKDGLRAARAGLGASALLSGLVPAAFIQVGLANEILFSAPRLLAAAGLSSLATAILVGLFLFSLGQAGGQRMVGLLGRASARLERLDRWNLALAAAAAGGYSFIILGWNGGYFQDFAVRLALFAPAAGLCGCFVRARWRGTGWVAALIGGALLAGAVYRAAAFFAQVTDYPFALYWSETSRYYYASLYFARSLYGLETPPSPRFDPANTLLLAIPFLAGQIPLWAHRLWQALLWVGVSGLTAWAGARRLRPLAGLQGRAIFAWLFLFLLVGPVYYQLQLAILLVLLGLPASPFTRRGVLQTTLVILAGSVWTGLTRIHWFAMPAVLAAAVILLEQPLEAQASGPYRWDRRAFGYVALLAGWGGLSFAVGFAAQNAFQVWMRIPKEWFVSYFQSDLLWYRLLPNPTYPQGLLPSALIVSLPLLAVTGLGLRNDWGRIHPIRRLAYALILAGLFAVGMAVSAKIGGGNNLHNLDAYLILLGLAGLYVYTGRIVYDRPVTDPSPAAPGSALRLAAGLALVWAGLLPVWAGLEEGGPINTYDRAAAAASLDLLRENVQKAARSGPVLFLSERQLLTYGDIPGVKLTAPYEREDLMEMAMSGNRAFLDRFHEEIRTQQYAMVVSEPLTLRKKGQAKDFGDENDRWVNEVSTWVLCYYEPKKYLRDEHIRWYTPRITNEGRPENCP